MLSDAESTATISAERRDFTSAVPRWFWLLTAALTAVVVAPVWLCDYFPSHNAPALLAVAHVAGHYHDPSCAYSSYYDLHFFPTPYWFQFWITIPLLNWLDPPLVLKILITILIVLRTGAVMYFLRQIGAGHVIYGLACLPLAYDFVLMRGYYNFHAGISLALVVMGFHLQHRDRWTAASIAGLNVLTLLLYFTHPIPLAATGILLSVYELVLTRSVSRIAGLFFRGFVPSFALLVGFLLWSRENNAWSGVEFVYGSLSSKIQNVHFRGATPVAVIPNLLSLGLLGVLGAIGARKISRSRNVEPTPASGALASRQSWLPWLAVWVGGALLYLATPSNLLGWHKADVHVLPFSFLLFLAVPPPLVTARGRGLFCTLAAAAVLAGIGPLTVGLLRASDDVKEFTAGLDAVPRQVKLLPLVNTQRSEEGWSLGDAFEPVQWADSYYAMASGSGIGRGLMANNTLYPAWFKDFRDRGKTQFPDVDLNRPTNEQLDVAAATYGAIILWDTDSTLRTQFEDRGFEVAFARGRLTVLVRRSNSSGLVQGQTP